MYPTTDPALRSFLPVAADSHFPIQNLPYGVFRRPGEPGARVGVAVGEQVLDLTALEGHGLLDTPHLRDRRVFSAGKLNPFLALGRPAWSEARAPGSQLLRADEPTLRDDADLKAQVLVPADRVRMMLPVEVGD